MLTSVRQTIRRRRLLAPGDAVIVGVSGGGDSVGLMHALAELRAEFDLRLSVASVDHGLRPESAAEVAGVGAAAADLGLAFHPLSVRLAPGGNVQSRAREARYVALRSLASTGCVIALGHTLDDQAETVMGRILRGAGLRGLSGVQPRRDDGVVRPLIDTSRENVRRFLRERGASWIEDPSNESVAFERVRIRRALATFAEEDSQLSAHLAALADDARAAEEALKAMSSSLGPSIASLAAALPALRMVALRRLTEEATHRAPRRSHLEDLERAVLSGAGEVLLGGGFRATVKNGVLIFEKGGWEGRSG